MDVDAGEGGSALSGDEVAGGNQLLHQRKRQEWRRHPHEQMKEDFEANPVEIPSLSVVIPSSPVATAGSTLTTSTKNWRAHVHSVTMQLIGEESRDFNLFVAGAREDISGT
ncbi:hypothetical protein Dsin_021507 [Dipteronia sinensis]|uniref:Uncharacterized protein n=1 Tax=Dipteronia sinensis TaxID=43782 RepID=A0AAE0A0N4_9ROSI|nr:hypothetical protein Dsin_021507 [Dipteronia sinensis]